MVPLHVLTMSLSFFLYNTCVVTSMPLIKYVQWLPFVAEQGIPTRY